MAKLNFHFFSIVTPVILSILYILIFDLLLVKHFFVINKVENCLIFFVESMRHFFRTL